MAIPLSNRTLDRFTIAKKPSHPRHHIEPGILHLGVGGFHRAHQAVYTQDVLDSGDHRWGIIGASLKRPTMRDLLLPQDFLYTVGTVYPNDVSYRVIGAVQQVLNLNAQRQSLLELIASPKTKIITLTITEKGYGLNAQGELDTDQLDIRHDLEHPMQPTSAPGLIARGLLQRMQEKSGKLSILSCDNLADNGKCLERAIHTLSQLIYPELVSWLQDHVSFPGTMVDRIVPSTSDEDRRALTHQSGFEDQALVIAEPFSQWVIENKFVNDRPQWELAGAELTADVAPWEQAKLRLLNASHSAIAYLGLICGHEFVHQAMADPIIARFARYLLDQEITPVLTCPTGFNPDDYKTSVLDRFSNQHIRYPTSQVAGDGAKKLIQRIIPTVNDHLARGATSPGLTLVIAAWLQCRLTPAIATQFPDVDIVVKGRDIRATVEANRGLLGNPGQNSDFLDNLAAAVTSLQAEKTQTVLKRVIATGLV